VSLSDSYNAGRSKLRQAEETSALEMDLDNDAGRPQRKKRRALPPSASESSPKRNKRQAKVQKKAKRVATWLRCGELFSNQFTTDSLLSLLVKQFLKSVNIWRSYRQEGTNQSLIICKSILLQYLFFCVAADVYSHTVGILVWPLYVSFSQ